MDTRQRRQLTARRDKLGREQVGELVCWQFPCNAGTRRARVGATELLHGLRFSGRPALEFTSINQGPIPGAAQLVQDLGGFWGANDTPAVKAPVPVPAQNSQGITALHLHLHEHLVLRLHMSKVFDRYSFLSGRMQGAASIHCRRNKGGSMSMLGLTVLVLISSIEHCSFAASCVASQSMPVPRRSYSGDEHPAGA